MRTAEHRADPRRIARAEAVCRPDLRHPIGLAVPAVRRRDSRSNRRRGLPVCGQTERRRCLEKRARRQRPRLGCRMLDQARGSCRRSLSAANSLHVSRAPHGARAGRPDRDRWRDRVPKRRPARSRSVPAEQNASRTTVRFPPRSSDIRDPPTRNQQAPMFRGHFSGRLEHLPSVMISDAKRVG